MIGLILAVLLHPFHVSVTEFVFNERSTQIEISSKVFIDDIEIALRNYTNNEDYTFTESDQELVGAYFKAHLKLAINGNPRTYEFLGFETEDEAIWCYIEINEEEPIIHLGLQCDLITEIFEDQQNMIHFKKGDLKRSYILNLKKTETEFQPSKE